MDTQRTKDKKSLSKRDELEKGDVFSRGQEEKVEEFDDQRLDDDGMSNQRYVHQTNKDMNNNNKNK